MAVIQIECYRVTCDTCGCDFEDGSGILRHYDWPGDAEGEATDYDWTVWEGHQWCDRHDCVPLCVCGHGLSPKKGERSGSPSVTSIRVSDSS